MPSTNPQTPVPNTVPTKKQFKYGIGWKVEISVILTLFAVYWYQVLDTTAKPPLPADFVVPEPLTIRWPSFERTFKDSKGNTLATYKWLPKSTPKGLVFIFPGYGDYSESNANIAEALVQHNFAVFGIDPLGHGRSDGLQMYIEDFNASVVECLQWVRQVKSEYPKQKAFLWGGSLGGTTVINMLLQSHNGEFSGAYIGAPAIKADNLYPILQKVVG